ncbi:D-alanyl-D-alanine carboxypeptidase family protein [Chelatococcus reniformis]|uniref:Peptidase S11 D-alanyl-D-alanine carboxypeptidase A N-terminal domain-containing protein n=1 Tax=Chelatococcus reniformis TaxID=1494448 RepID=A0A916UP41_9HYPH|nr:D-alanyl-D-alanine carboxypeptidase family protein [Chelatococcus reniformis]GGC79713.1 hypothetical protein GCM10010994_42200 [Chelatococcus reniformis]
MSLSRLARFAAGLAVALPIALSALPKRAEAAPILVADVRTGRVLYAKEATEPWYPASVTKLLTAYLTLNALRDGRLQADTPLRVSARAAAAVPSKMGFKPGTEVTVENALKMMLVKSANDMAVVLAEGVGGSVENFSEMMNATAAQIGMRQSHFVNPNGLPDDRNQTTARDLAVLARTILLEYPKNTDLFGIGALQFGKRTLRNTNGLIGRYPGADGMKTGFICSSGFNVVATATRGSRRLIVVVLGARSGAERTLKAAALFDRGFADGGWGGPGTLDTLPISYTSGPPDLRNSICGPGRYRGEEEAETASQTTTTDNPIFALFSRPQAADWDVDVSSLGPLGPRTASTPIPVFVGRTPGSEPEPKVAKQRGRAKTATAFAPDQAGEADTAEGQRALKAATKPVGKAAAKGKAQAQTKPHGKDKATGDAAAAAAKGHAKAKGEGKPAAAKPAAGKPTPGKPAAGKEGKSAANKTGPTAQSSR